MLISPDKFKFHPSFDAFKELSSSVFIKNLILVKLFVLHCYSHTHSPISTLEVRRENESGTSIVGFGICEHAFDVLAVSIQ